MSEVIQDDGGPWGANSAHLAQDTPLSIGRLSHCPFSHRPPDPRPVTQTNTVPTPVAKRLTSPFRSLLRVVKQRTMKKARPQPAKFDPAPLANRARHYATPSASLASSSNMTPSSSLTSSSTLASSSIRTPSSSFTLDSGYASRQGSLHVYGAPPWLSSSTPSPPSINPLTHATYGCPHIQHCQTTFQQSCVCVEQSMADTYPTSLPSRCGAQPMFYNREQSPSRGNLQIHPAFDSSVPAPSTVRTSFSTLNSSSIRTPSSSFTLDSGYASRQASLYAHGVQPLRSNHTSSVTSSPLKPMSDTYPFSIPFRCEAQPIFPNREQSSVWPNLSIHPSFDYPHLRRSEATSWPPHLSDEQSANPYSQPKTLNRQWTQEVWGNQESGIFSLRTDSPMPLESSLRDGACSTPQEAPTLLRMPDPHDYIPSRGLREDTNPSTPFDPSLIYVDRHLVLLDTHLSPLPTRHNNDISKGDNLASQLGPANFEATNTAEVATLAQQCEGSQFFDDTPPPANPESSSNIHLPVYAPYLQGSEVPILSIGSGSSPKPTNTSEPHSLERAPPVSLQTSSDKLLLEEDTQAKGAGQNAQYSLPQEHETIIPAQQRSKPDYLQKSIALGGELLPTSMVASQCPGSISPRLTSFIYPSSSFNIGSSSQLVSRSIPQAPDPASAPIDLPVRLCPQPSFFSGSPKSSSSACIPRHDTRLLVPKIFEHSVESSSLPALPFSSSQCTLMSSTAILLLASASKSLLITQLLGVTMHLPVPIKRLVKLAESVLTGTCRIIHDFSNQNRKTRYAQIGPRITALQELSVLARLLPSTLSGPPDETESLQIVRIHVYDHRQLTGLCTTVSGWRWIVGSNRRLPSVCTSMLSRISPVIPRNTKSWPAASPPVVFGAGELQKLDLDLSQKTETQEPWEIGNHVECVQEHLLGGVHRIERNLESKGNRKDRRFLGTPRATRQGIMGSPPPHRCHLAFRRLNEPRRPKPIQQPAITPSPPIPLPANSQYNSGAPEWAATEPVANIAAHQPRYYDGGNSTVQPPASPPNPTSLSVSTEFNIHGPAWNEGFVAG
ncbi:unnamed protein product [Rhizoctonia solani]|uniref:Uncharacterized protein n=1 Tax=Rhizoctonia solani TaxID=456999 RepID=A0A8H3BFC3_9AGAM|nr:unnamed protein product [Rhizoctonia solani]CAE6485625.1 unnamed protein product [Rhizoctonia solani]